MTTYKAMTVLEEMTAHQINLLPSLAEQLHGVNDGTQNDLTSSQRRQLRRELLDINAKLRGIIDRYEETTQ